MALSAKERERRRKQYLTGKSLAGDDEAGPGHERETNDKQYMDDLDQLEKDIEELRHQYELYFMGIEMREPKDQHTQMKNKIRRWHGVKMGNTAVRFRMNQFRARVVSMETYWARVMRQKEAGTYHRDKERLNRKEAKRVAMEMEAERRKKVERGEAPQSDVASTVDGRAAPPNDGRAITGAALAEGRSAAETAGGRPGRPGQASRSASRPSATSAADLTEPKLRRLYQTYASARKRCGEGVDLRYEDMAAALRKQVPKLIKDTGARSVEFKVVIRSGRAVLKALPKHKDKK